MFVERAGDADADSDTDALGFPHYLVMVREDVAREYFLDPDEGPARVAAAAAKFPEVVASWDGHLPTDPEGSATMAVLCTADTEFV